MTGYALVNIHMKKYLISCFLEGKTMEAICKIRNLDNSIVQKHIIDGKIKYRFLVHSNDTNELFKSIAKAGKEDKIFFLNSMSEDNKNKLTEANKNYLCGNAP